MALVPTAMAATMLARATGGGFIDRPPHFALSRIYNLIAEGVVLTLLDPTSTIITVNYGPGQPSVPVNSGVAGPIAGFDGLDPDRYTTICQTASGFFGPFSLPFFVGLGGIIEYVAANVQMTDIFVPTGNGVGVLGGGGILFNADDCFDNLKSRAESNGIMVVKLLTPGDPTGHVPDPLTPLPDPITGEDLFVGDLFTRAEILLRAISTTLAVELLSAAKGGIPVVGGFNPLAPPITASTITSFLF